MYFGMEGIYGSAGGFRVETRSVFKIVFFKLYNYYLMHFAIFI